MSDSPSSSVLRTVIKEVVTSTALGVVIIQTQRVPIPTPAVVALALTGGLAIGAGMWALGSWTRRAMEEEVPWWGILMRLAAWAQVIALSALAMIHDPTIGMLCVGFLAREALPAVVLPLRDRWRARVGPPRPETLRRDWAPDTTPVEIPQPRRPAQARTGPRR